MKHMLILSLILLVGCQQAVVDYDTLRFPEFFEDLTVLEQEFGTNFGEEQIGGTMISLDQATPFLAELYILRQDVLEGSSPDRGVMHDFIQVRIQMVQAQIKYQKAVSLDGASCEEPDKLQEATNYYEETRIHALTAIDILDNILQLSSYSHIIGIDDTRTKFYFSDFDFVIKKIKEGYLILRDVCGLQVI